MLVGILVALLLIVCVCFEVCMVSRPREGGAGSDRFSPGHQRHDDHRETHLPAPREDLSNDR